MSEKLIKKKSEKIQEKDIDTLVKEKVGEN
jgi:hypothetical protein